MIRRHLSLAALCLISFAAATGCDQTLGDYIVIPGFAGFEISYVRVVNASPDIGEVDVWNRSYPYFPDLNVGDATDYTRMNDGVRTLTAVDTDDTDDSSPIVEMELKFPIDTYHTVLVMGESDEYQLVRFDDDRTPPILDGFRFRVIHAVVGGPMVRPFGASDEALAAAIGYGQATGSVEYDGASGEITIRRTDNNAVLWTADADTLADNKSYTIVVYADANDAVQFLVLENNLSAD